MQSALRRRSCSVRMVPSPNGGFVFGSVHCSLIPSRQVTLMSQVASAKPLSIGALEAGYPLYCKAMRILIRDGKTLEQIQRSLCWDRLRSLHHCLPRSYQDPEMMYLHLKREICA